MEVNDCNSQWNYKHFLFFRGLFKCEYLSPSHLNTQRDLILFLAPLSSSSFLSVPTSNSAVQMHSRAGQLSKCGLRWIEKTAENWNGHRIKGSEQDKRIKDSWCYPF